MTTDLSTIKTDADALAAYEAGATLPQIAKALSSHAASIRYRLIKLVGGAAKWAALVQAHGTANVVGGPRAPVNDGDVDTVASGKGWAVEFVHALNRWLYTSPDGQTTYTPAADSQQADLLYQPRTKGLPVLRLRLYDRPKAERRAERTAEERAEQQAAAVARRMAAKRAKKTQRKTVAAA